MSTPGILSADSSLLKFEQCFDVLETLGKGAFSVVKKCRGKVDDIKGKDFAVKIIKINQLTSKNKFKLERESRICKILKHPNIVSLYLTFSVTQFNIYYIYQLIRIVFVTINLRSTIINKTI